MIDLQNKPPWYAPRVNSASKVPAIAYGGPKVPPDEPSPESIKITESLVLLEFVADLYPNAHLLPADPVQRARARFFVEAVSTKLVPAWMTLKSGAPESSQAFLDTIESIQALLPPQGFAIGEYSIADISVAPFIARAHVALGNEIGAYAVGEGKKILEALQQPRFARFQKYWADLQVRPSFQATFNKASLVVCRWPSDRVNLTLWPPYRITSLRSIRGASVTCVRSNDYFNFRSVSTFDALSYFLRNQVFATDHSAVRRCAVNAAACGTLQ